MGEEAQLDTAKLNDMNAKAQEARSKEQSEKSSAEQKARLMRIYREMLLKAGVDANKQTKHLHHIDKMNYSDTMQTGRLSERMYDSIRKERKFDRFNRPVRNKQNRQKALVANIKDQFMAKEATRGEDGEYVDPASQRLKTAKWKIGYRKWVRAPPGLSESLVAVLNSDGNEDIFAWDGEWASGAMNGFGLYEFIDKNTYKGKMVNNVRNGPGISKYANGHVYDGESKDGKFHGFGKLKYADGSIYEGTWKNGRRHGNGTLTFPSGYVYKGDWLLGKQHGFGTVTSTAAKVSYRGHFAFGKVRTGFGALTVEDPPKSGKIKEMRQEFSFAYGASLRDVRHFMVAEWKRQKQQAIDDRNRIFGLQEMVIIREQIQEARDAIYKDRRDKRQAVLDEKRRLDQERRKKIKEKQQEQLASMSRMGEGDGAAPG